MRFHLVITELNVGGAEACMTEIACGLKDRGHDIRVISLGSAPETVRKKLVDWIRQKNISIDFLNARGAKDWFKVQNRLKAIARRDRPDAAMSFLFHANLASSFVYPKLDIPFVAGVRVADRSGWRAWLSRRVYRKSSRIVCVSERVADHVKEIEGAPADRVCVVTNGIDVRKVQQSRKSDFYERCLSKARIKLPYLLYVGRYDQQKQIPWLLQLVRDASFRNTGIQLVMIGDGNLRDKVEAAAREFPERLVNLGWQSEVLPWIQGCELLLLPSAYEGMPNVVLEAMACGKPVAATAVEGVSELLGDAARDQTSPNNDPSAWIEMILKLISDAKQRELLGRANFERCQEAFDLSSKIDAYEQLLVSVGR